MPVGAAAISLPASRGSPATPSGALAEVVEERLKEVDRPPLRREGLDDASWVLLDYGWVVVHLLQPEPREYYDLELFWADAERVPLEDLGVTEDPAEGPQPE